MMRSDSGACLHMNSKISVLREKQDRNVLKLSTPQFSGNKGNVPIQGLRLCLMVDHTSHNAVHFSYIFLLVNTITISSFTD